MSENTFARRSFRLFRSEQQSKANVCLNASPQKWAIGSPSRSRIRKISRRFRQNARCLTWFHAIANSKSRWQTFSIKATDVAAFCKNAGPQALRLDYVTDASRLAFYTPDFLVRTTDGQYLLVETKGRVDKDVPLKVGAAVAWCKATSKKTPWKFLYVPEGVFQKFSGDSFGELESSALRI